MGRLVAALVVGCGVLSSPAWACSCVRWPVEQAIGSVDALFVGEVMKVEPEAVAASEVEDRLAELERQVDVLKGLEPLRVRLRVEKVFRGASMEPEAVTTVFTSGAPGACGFRFEVGRKYLVFARRSGEELHVGSCSHTQPVEQATSILERL